MAKFKSELPLELIKQFEKLVNSDARKMLGEMVDAGAEIAMNNVKSNMRKSFDSTEKLEKCLVKTKVYKTKSDDGINSKVAFYGYFVNEQGKRVPAPLVAMAREYGTSNGEAKKPFIRKAFEKAEITSVMLKVQEKYIPNE